MAVLQRQNFFCSLKTSGSKRRSISFEQLSEVQRRRLLMLAEGVSLREIARREGKDIKSIRESIEWARKKFLKYF